MITDAQVHLWEANRADRPWAADGKPPLPEPMTGERMLAMMDTAGVDRAIISPLMLPDWAPDYALEVAARHSSRFKVMGWYWPEKHERHDALARWLDDPRMCSMRLRLHTQERLELMLSPRMEPFWSAVERHGIPVAFMLENNDARAMSRIALRHPGLKLVVDHFNWPNTPDSREPKMSQLEELSACPNVYIKVSSLPRFSTGGPPFDDMHPLIRRVHAAYGARRLMWGADQTQIMSLGLCGYQDSVDIIRVGAVRYLPAEDIDWMLNGTASVVFNWR